MCHQHKLSRRIARFRAPLVAALVLAVGGCNHDNSFETDATAEPVDPGVAADSSLSTDSTLAAADTSAADTSSIDDDTPLSEEPDGGAMVDEPLSASISYAGGIPIGTFHQPNSAYGSRYNGALRNIWPAYLNSNLAAIKSRGGKVMLSLAGAESNFKDAQGHFSLTKWKARVARFRNVNFSRYITDGTIIGHYLIDEPNDASNWNGQRISGATLDEMARYSKQLWPGMATVVRAYPDYLAGYSGTYRYLDAAWAQYAYRKGNIGTFTSKNVALAKRKGLALVVGLNVLKGGPNGARMSASQVKSWGSTLLSSSYPCAFLSWQYSSSYLGTSSMKSAMSALRSKAENRSRKSCRG